MKLNVAKEVAALERMTSKQLRVRYAEVFGERTNGRNKTWLVRRIVWQLQAKAHGGLSERARRRAEELAEGMEIRTSPPPIKAPKAEEETQVQVLRFKPDDRLPTTGTIITRNYKGVLLRVKVLEQGV